MSSIYVTEYCFMKQFSQLHIMHSALLSMINVFCITGYSKKKKDPNDSDPKTIVPVVGSVALAPH